MSVTVAKAREIYTLLNEVERKLDSTETKAKQATVSYADLYNVVQDVFYLLRRMGLPDDVERGIATIYRLVAALNALRVASLALTAATGPIGLVVAGVGVLVSGVGLMTAIGSYG